MSLKGHWLCSRIKEKQAEYWRRQRHPTPVLLPGKSCGRRSLVGCSPWGSLRVGHNWVTSLSLFTFMHWRRKWQPLQCSCLENPRDSRAWWAAVYGVAQSRTRLKRLSSTGIKTIPMEKKCKKAKWLPGEALQIAVKRRQAKSKGEKERYKHLNAEF